jgi:hypothetical protein
MGRTPLTEEQVHARVATYCERYGVSPGREGVPPFPTGRRETRQHREWLAVYRALQRARARAAVAAPVAPDALSATPECPVCSRRVERALAVPYPRRAAGPVPLHPACAELARLADTLGPSALEGLRHFLWPAKAGGSTRPSRR